MRVHWACGPLLLLLGVPCHGAAAQQVATTTVSGQLALLERTGATKADLASVIVYLQPLGAFADEVRDAGRDEASIVMHGREFVPRTAVIRTGGSVRFPNDDPFSHNVFSNTDPERFDLGLYRRGTTRTTSFRRPGVYAIYCNIHARMVSYVIAVPTRHVVSAQSDGRFTLADVPFGTYRLHVWHERATPASVELTVTASNAPVRLTLDARGYVAGPHLNKFGMPYSSTRADRY